MSQGAPKILLTGFEAFGASSINPTEQLIRAAQAGDPLVVPHAYRGRISGSNPTRGAADIHSLLPEPPTMLDESRTSLAGNVSGELLRAVVLPVTYQDAFVKLENEIAQFAPDIVVCTGQAGGRSHIEFERQAVNLINSNEPDNSGAVVKNREISTGGAAIYATTLPIDEMCEAVVQAGVPARFSDSAGTYVCNYVFYRLQEKLRYGAAARSGFIHFPCLPEQAKPGAPSMELNDMKRGLLQILTVLSRQAARSSHVLAIGLMTMLASLLMFAAGSSAQAANACDVTGRYIDVDTTFKLLFQCNDGKIEGLHLVALGWNGAGKQVQGDRRTPLGVYPLGEPRDSAYFKFIPIGYPTPEQRRKGYTGYAVGVHGPAKEYDFLGDVTAVINWTDGCIALGTGRETLDVAQWVSDNQVRSIRIR